MHTIIFFMYCLSVYILLLLIIIHKITYIIPLWTFNQTVNFFYILIFNTYRQIDSIMSAITIPEFKYSKQSSQGREERINFIIDEVKKDPDFHFDGPAYSKERCTNLAAITDLINLCLRLMLYGPQTRKDITEQILLMMKIL